MRGGALVILGWAQELRGESMAAMASYEAALALSESHGESMYRMLALLSMGGAKWRHGEPDHAVQLVRQSLGLARLVNDRRTAAYCLETLAWIAGDADSPRIAAIGIIAILPKSEEKEECRGAANEYLVCRDQSHGSYGLIKHISRARRKYDAPASLRPVKILI